jgi:hypothetical protein
MALDLCGLHYQRSRSKNSNINRPVRSYSRIGDWTEWKLNHQGYMLSTRSIDGKAEYRLQHRWAMEQKLGRSLFDAENVHHINGDRTDNRFENLELWNTKQPCGQRVEDKIVWAKELLAEYGYSVS